MLSTFTPPVSLPSSLCPTSAPARFCVHTPGATRMEGYYKILHTQKVAYIVQYTMCVDAAIWSCYVDFCPTLILMAWACQEADDTVPCIQAQCLESHKMHELIDQCKGSNGGRVQSGVYITALICCPYRLLAQFPLHL
ncbi:hypothetical protein K439DRAFT_1625394 [Ramaria rubella]|nr:hypothetical protein K439DRAFT_1625394 [Ramaria rubella]